METIDIKNQTTQNFIEVYDPLVKTFIKQIKGINYENLPEPFIPVFGKTYHNNPYKLAFVGWETRNNHDLSGFIQDCETVLDDHPKYLFRFHEDLFPKSSNENEYQFQYWGNNFGISFWDFILKFLGEFYQLNNWKILKDSSNPQSKEIQQSFIWGNHDSIERYEISAGKKGGDYNSYLKLKEASLMFDNASHLIKALHPKVVIITHWADDENWLPWNQYLQKEGIKEENVTEDLYYYHLTNTDTHVFWTKHPRTLKKIGISKIIGLILKKIEEEKIYTSFPAKEKYASIRLFSNELDSIAKRTGLQLSYFPNQVNLGAADSGFYFHKPEWKLAIGMGFDEDFTRNFFHGIYVKDELSDNERQEILETFGCDETPTIAWPSWKWHTEHRNWTDLTFKSIRNGDFSRKIENTVKTYLNSLNRNKITV